MIRRFLSFVLLVAFAAGFGYYWWQAYQLRQQVDRLQAEVVHLKKLEAHRAGKHAASSAASTGETEDSAAAEGWLALANQHADKAKAAFDNHDYGIAQTEFSQAVEDVRRGTQEPVQATQASLNQVRQKIAELEGDMGSVLNRVKATVGQ
jgi:predicted negative regulator of RcsB-dependent stress response